RSPCAARGASRRRSRSTGPPARPAPRALPALDGYFGARSLLETAGIEFAAARSVASGGDVEAAAAELGYPVVLKALGTLHKSDVGGVVVGIAEVDELRAAVDDM